jgi:hypothetical protein
MNTQEFVNLDDNQVQTFEPVLKLVGGTDVATPSNVVEFKDAKQEPRCENGVCTLSWKPQRKIA